MTFPMTAGLITQNTWELTVRGRRYSAMLFGSHPRFLRTLALSRGSLVLVEDQTTRASVRSATGAGRSVPDYSGVSNPGPAEFNSKPDLRHLPQVMKAFMRF